LNTRLIYKFKVSVRIIVVSNYCVWWATYPGHKERLVSCGHRSKLFETHVMAANIVDSTGIEAIAFKLEQSHVLIIRT
jgi:hypothetical protein